MICLISGTNRPQSQTLRVTKILNQLYQDKGADTHLLDLNQLPAELFRPESYDKKPASFESFSKTVLDSEGLVVVTPEYNGSFPGVLKLFIDMLKFPESFEKRPVAFVGLAAGMWGALRSVEQLSLPNKGGSVVVSGRRRDVHQANQDQKHDDAEERPVEACLLFPREFFGFLRSQDTHVFSSLEDLGARRQSPC